MLLDYVTLCHHRGLEKAIVELPDVTRPMVVLHKYHCGVRYSNGQKQVTGFFEKLRKTDPGDHAPTLKTVSARSDALQALWEDIWPGWKIATLVKDEFRGPHQFFPLTPIGLEHGNDTESELGKADLRKRTLAPFGLLEPLLWLMYVNGVDAL